MEIFISSLIFPILFMQDETDIQWCKVIYKEPDSEFTKVKQGYFYDDDDFVKVVGDVKTTIIKKTFIVAIEFLHKEVNSVE